MDEIVELSVRYGIITPYTSFLVDETEDVLSEEGRDRGPSRSIKPWPLLPQRRLMGQGPVDKSEAKSVLRGAQAVPMAPAEIPSGADRGGGGGEVVPIREVVKYVGDKTFVLQDDVWIDTAYDVDKMTTTKVSFGSDNCFELLTARPEWGKYFALGTHVIVVLEGTPTRWWRARRQRWRCHPPRSPRQPSPPRFHTVPLPQQTSRPPHLPLPPLRRLGVVFAAEPALLCCCPWRAW